MFKHALRFVGMELDTKISVMMEILQVGMDAATHAQSRQDGLAVEDLLLKNQSVASLFPIKQS